MSAVSGVLDRLVPAEVHDRIGRVVIHENEFGFDPFGFNREMLKYASVGAWFLYRKYFRAESTGLENIPPGRVLLISNHSGQLPFDAVGIAGALLFDGEPPRFARSMVERWTATLPFVSYFFPRVGQIVGTPENCRAVLAKDEAILVFPEGAKGISKPFSRRYQLQEFGNGFMRLALETGTPIVPVAVIGAEEQAPAVNLSGLARLVGAPALPLTPTLVPVPLPVKYRLHFGAPMEFQGDPDDDDVEIDARVRQVRLAIESMIHTGLQARKHVFW
jgi:1-acyl-sn-glycerol-3-phosphate acyltransferase